MYPGSFCQFTLEEEEEEEKGGEGEAEEAGGFSVNWVGESFCSISSPSGQRTKSSCLEKKSASVHK